MDTVHDQETDSVRKEDAATTKDSDVVDAHRGLGTNLTRFDQNILFSYLFKNSLYVLLRTSRAPLDG